MPEGDTIFRTAAAIRKWIGGRVVTAAQTDVRGLAVEVDQLVGRTVSTVTAVGKHLLMQFDVQSEGAAAVTAPLLLRTHMLMTGSWHVYQVGAVWQRPKKQARIVIEVGDRLAVGFNVPVMELTMEAASDSHGVAHLGPDILMPSFGARDVVPRIRQLPADRAIGEVLLDQRVVAGIGNIYRCEALYVERISPWTSQGSLSSDSLVGVLRTAEGLMKQNLTPANVSRDLNAGTNRTWVYRRANRPCRTCGAPILSRPQGPQARTAYWCPNCQE
jgi:endonuclease VIII